MLSWLSWIEFVTAHIRISVELTFSTLDLIRLSCLLAEYDLMASIFNEIHSNLFQLQVQLKSNPVLYDPSWRLWKSLKMKVD